MEAQKCCNIGSDYSQHVGDVLERQKLARWHNPPTRSAIVLILHAIDKRTKTLPGNQVCVHVTPEASV